MSVNPKSPSFLSYLDNITNAILKNVSIDTYFGITNDKKRGVMFLVYKLIQNSFSGTSKLTDDEMKGFLTALCKKNEIMENYEFAEIIKDIIENFDTVNEFNKSTKLNHPQLTKQKE